MKIRNTKSGQRSGSAAVELAVCLPFLLVIVMGIWEVGRMVQVQQLVANAAREGGRQAAAGQKDNTAVRQAALNYLTNNGLTGLDISMVTLTNVTAAARSNPMTANQLDQFHITITIPYSAIKYSNLAQITPTTQLTASADWYCMRDTPVTVSTTIPTN